MKISATLDADAAVIALTDTVPRQVPYVAAIMLTRLAGDVRAGFQRRLPEVFDRPTDFTVRGVYTKRADKKGLESAVYFPGSDEEAGKAKREYMRPGALGTYARQQKKTEYLLTRLGFLPPGWVTIPGKRVRQDSHGNMPGSYYKQIINVLQLKPQALGAGRGISERAQRQAKKLGVESVFFVVPVGANKLGKNGGYLPSGVWRHLPGHQIMQMLKFVRKASYKKRFDVKEEGAAIVREQLPLRWKEAADLIREKFSQPRR